MYDTETPIPPVNFRYKKQKRTSIWKYFLAIIILISLVFLSLFAWKFLIPNNEFLQTYSTEDITVILDNEIINQSEFTEKIAVVIDNKPFLSYELVQLAFDPYLHWDDEQNLLIMTNYNSVIEMKTDQLTAFINEEEINLELPVTVIDNMPYLPIDFFASFYKIEAKYFNNTNVIDITSAGLPVQKGLIQKETTKVRFDTNIKEPVVADLAINDEIYIIGEKGNWYRIRTIDGVFGYIAKNDVQLAGIQLYTVDETIQKTPWKPLGSKINLTWEQVYSKNPNLAEMPDMTGVNVVSPTWFYLKDDIGNVSGNRASVEYVEWAHNKGMHVWGLYSNQFDPDLTSKFLKDVDARKRSIRQILAYAEMYNLDGINIDFENVYYEDKALLTQYVRELAVYLREQGLVVSVDVTIISQSANWSMMYDRVAYADIVDYVIVMTYDEHWAASPIAGSVASLPWVEKGLQGILEQVPNDKLILGVPFYTRVWEEKLQPDGKTKVSSRAVSMKLANEIIETNKANIIYDEKAKQHYAEYQDGNSTFKIWIEDTKSMEDRIKLVRQYDLAGVASWSRGFELPEIWSTIKEVITKQPLEMILQ